MREAIFLDRDGVLNDNKKPVNSPEDLVLYPNVKEALNKLQNAGYELFVVTNQGGIELGYISEKDLEKIHKRLLDELKQYCKITEIAYCPYYHKKSYDRKPQPGMILKLSKKYNINLEKSWMIGDMNTDVETGIRAGCKTAKIGKNFHKADVVGKDLMEVVDRILT